MLVIGVYTAAGETEYFGSFSGLGLYGLLNLFKIGKVAFLTLIYLPFMTRGMNADGMSPLMGLADKLLVTRKLIGHKEGCLHIMIL